MKNQSYIPDEEMRKNPWKKQLNEVEIGDLPGR